MLHATPRPRAYVALRSSAVTAVDAWAGVSKLRRMNDFRRVAGRAAVMIAAIGATTACDRSKAPPPIDSATPKSAAGIDSSTPASASTWNPDIGPVLLISASTPTEAVVLLPGDSASRARLASIPRPALATLLSRAGTVQDADVPAVADSGVCAVATITGSPPPRPWNVGFIGGVVAPLAVDSTESLNHADSLPIVTWMNRLASGLANDSAGRFVGLPFVVRTIWRFNLTDGTQVVAANLWRQINQEATPLQEHTFLLAERSPSDTTYSTAYSERSHGDEETIATHDVLAAALLGANKRPALVVARDYGDAASYIMIERIGPAKWRAGWSSPRRHC